MPRKTILVTNADSRIGHALAHELDQQGHRVLLACAAPDLARQLHHAIGSNAMVMAIDPSRRASLHELTDRVHAEVGELDVLINNAADFDPSLQRREITPDGFEKIWFVNHLAPTLLTNRLMDLLIASPRGRVLEIPPRAALPHPLLTINLSDPMFARTSFNASRASHQSKLAREAHTHWLSQQLIGTMTSTQCLDAARVKLDLSPYPNVPAWLKNLHALKSFFALSPQRVAEICAGAINADATPSENGKRLSASFKRIELPVYAKDPLCTRQVMDLTFKQLGIAPAITYEHGS